MSQGSGQDEPVSALSTEQVLRMETEELWGKEEADAIWDAGPSAGKTPLERYGSAMLEKEQAALCLSGGGIRSAAFGLGVVQGLARKNLLSGFQYLSTVSGGGYLGGFLSRWIHEKHGNVSEVEDALAGRGELCAVDPAPIRWLRENSNFITPRIGIASADTWTAIAISLRNVLVNWLVFIPLLLLAAAVPNLAASLLVTSGALSGLWLACGTALIGFATYRAARDLPSHHRFEHRKHHGGPYVFRRIVIPAALGPAALAAGVAPDLIGVERQTAGQATNGGWPFDWFAVFSGDARVVRALTVAFACLVGSLLGGYVAAWIAASRIPDRELRRSNFKGFWQNLPVWAIGSVLAALVYVLGLSLMSRVPCSTDVASCGRKVDVLTTAAVLWGIVAQLVLNVLFVAFRWVSPDQELSPDLDREWLARVSAQKLRLGLAWTLFAAATLLPLHIVAWLGGAANVQPALDAVWEPVVGAVGVIASIIAAFGGKAAATGHKSDQRSARRLLTPEVIVGAATAVAIVFLLVLLGRAEFVVAERLAFRLLDNGLDAGGFQLVLGHVLTMGVIGLLLFVTSQSVKVNRFSLNGMYRNRLARAFLGAARDQRPDADPFTGFAPSDNIRLHKLQAVHGASGRRVLMPVINATLNLVGGTRLAWQERKAQAFIFTPVSCGSDALVDRATGQCKGQYIRSSVYAGSEPDSGLKDEDASGLKAKGVTLATAVAISGAAASPSMGYHSSPATAFLMTLFNVRLGAWLPNPGRDDLPDAIKSSGPRNVLRPLLRELLGLTDAQGHSVYLSDGGHFENLGLYEMVRRRCRYIVVSDAGCDPGATFADLGNALRKIRIDLGVRITIDTLNIASRAEWQRDKSTYFALGTVHYREGKGKLLYIKPACHHGVPADVRAYALKSESFPHESTADQWFSESQFESYRSLGANLVDRLGAQGDEEPQCYEAGDLAAFFRDVDGRIAQARKEQEGSQEVPDASGRREPSRSAREGILDVEPAAANRAKTDGADPWPSALPSVPDAPSSADVRAGALAGIVPAEAVIVGGASRGAEREEDRADLTPSNGR